MRCSPSWHVYAIRSVCAAVIAIFALIQILFARFALVPSPTFTRIRRHTLPTIETVRIANRHTIMTVSGVSLLACAIIRSRSVGTNCIIVAQVRVSRTFVNLHTIPLVRLGIALQTLALVRAVDVHAFGIHITMMSFLAAPLQTLV